MPGGRRLPRTVRSTVSATVPLIPGDMTSNRYSPLGAAIPTLPGLEQPTAPKHFPFPTTPVESEFVFEMMMFSYSMIVCGLQFLHLYRSVWWLPHSYTSQAMNFYLIDMHLIVFITVLLSRRIMYLMGYNAIIKLIPSKFQDIACLSYRSLLFGVMFAVLSYCGLLIVQNQILNILFLCYPILVYLILFGFNITPFYDLFTWNSGAVPPLHACTSSASEIRTEVENLKINFNNRMKQILFSSILNAYYAGFIPCCFAQNFLYYDVYWTTQHVIFIFLGCFFSFYIHILPLRYCDTLHRSALHLGTWDRMETRSVLPVAYTWQEDMLWPYSALVRHGREMYRAQGDSNSAEPGNTMHYRFYNIFINPSVVLSGFLAIHIFLVLFQLALLVKSTYWYCILSLTFLLFFNSYTLYKMGRDYLVSSKIYRAEQALHDKLFVNYTRVLFPTNPKILNQMFY